MQNTTYPTSVERIFDALHNHRAGLFSTAELQTIAYALGELGWSEPGGSEPGEPREILRDEVASELADRGEAI